MKKRWLIFINCIITLGMIIGIIFINNTIIYNATIKLILSCLVGFYIYISFKYIKEK